MQLISTKDAASTLGVSSATIRNWINHGYLTPAEGSKSKFLPNEVSSLKRKIESGEIDRLRRRANKKRSDSSFIPEEYLFDPESEIELVAITQCIKASTLELDVALFVLTLRRLTLAGELFEFDRHALLKAQASCSWRRSCIEKEMTEWRESLVLVEGRKLELYQELFDLLSLEGNGDYLGVLYQAGLLEGSKSETGIYYTPKKLIDDSLVDKVFSGTRFIDPCCGTGQYLLRAIELGCTKISQVAGVEVDPIAARIARINVILALPDQATRPNIVLADALTEFATGGLFCETNNALGAFDSREALYVKALSSRSAKQFDMNFQQIKPACCDVFVWQVTLMILINMRSIPSGYWMLSGRHTNGRRRGSETHVLAA